MSGLPLPEGWEAVASEYGSEYVYYWNRYTNETTWERPLVQVKRKWGASASLRPMPSGCFIFPQPAQMPPRRSKMTKSTDVFKVLLARGMPSAVSSGGASKPAPASSRAAAKGGKGKGKGKKGEEAKPQVADAPPVPAAESKEWWRGSPSCHSYLPLDTLVACARVNRAWRTALLDSGFDYGVATFGIAMARWRAKSNEAKPSADVDAPAELSKRLSILLQSQTMASGARLREVRQFLCWHGDINQKNATCLDDPAAKAFLPSVLRETWQRIYDPGFWLALAAVEPVGSYLSDGVKGMMWAFATPAGMPSDYHTIREASDEVHEEDDDQDDDWGEEDMTLTCRECSRYAQEARLQEFYTRAFGLQAYSLPLLPLPPVPALLPIPSFLLSSLPLTFCLDRAVLLHGHVPTPQRLCLHEGRADLLQAERCDSVRRMRRLRPCLVF